MADQNYGLYGGLGAFIIAILSALGFKGRIDKLEKTKLDTTAFTQFEKAQKSDHERIDRNFDKLFEKLDDIHRDMPKRNND